MMGWSEKDPAVVEHAKTLAAKSRQAVYPLVQELTKIKHPEKGPLLVRLGERLYADLDEITKHLER
jgi:hypothetical protein